MLVIEALLHELPNAHVHIYHSEEGFTAAGAAFCSPLQTRMTTGEFPDVTNPHTEHHCGDLFVAVAGQYEPFTGPFTADITLYPFAFTQGLSSIRRYKTSYELTPALHDSPISNDLHSPYGTVILDPSLRAAREERNRWDRATFTGARAAWRSAVMKPEQNTAIEALAHREGWKVDEAIWSLCYLRDEAAFARDVRSLATVIRNNPSDLPHTDRAVPPHVLIHTLGQPWHSSERWLLGLADLGVRILSADGSVIGPTDSDIAPTITIVAHPSIDNPFMRQAFAQLVGCAVRDTHDTHWIDFPVYVTGSASWLESLSAGGMPLHDGEDVEAVLSRIRSRHSRRNSASWEGRICQASRGLPFSLRRTIALSPKWSGVTPVETDTESSSGTAPRPVPAHKLSTV